MIGAGNRLNLAFDRVAKSEPKSKSSLVTVRLSAEERERLEELAAGMTLSAYTRRYRQPKYRDAPRFRGAIER
jgi:hypothetical protein